MFAGINLGNGVGSGRALEVEASGLSDILSSCPSTTFFFGVPFAVRLDDGSDLILNAFGLSLREIFFLRSMGPSGGELRTEEAGDGSAGGSERSDPMSTSMIVYGRTWSVDGMSVMVG
jgi:hypothetical protein